MTAGLIYVPTIGNIICEEMCSYGLVIDRFQVRQYIIGYKEPPVLREGGAQHDEKRGGRMNLGYVFVG